MNERRTLPLGAVCSSLGGLWGEAEPAAGRVEVLAIRGTDFGAVKRGDFTNVPRRFVTPKVLERRKLDPACVLIEASGGSSTQPVGRTLSLQGSRLDKAPCPVSAASFCKILRVDISRAEPRFVSAVLEAAYDSGELDPFQSQSTGLRNLRTKQLLSDFKVHLPSRSTQVRIVAVLSAFDELIGINDRRIELLENLARSLYHEWFVRLRFPGAAAGTYGPGELPAGWTVRPLGEVAVNLDRLRRPLSKVDRANRPGNFPYYGAAKLIDWIDDWIFEGEHLLFAEDGTVQTPDGQPVLQLVDERFWANNHTHVLQGQAVSTRFLFLSCQRHPISGYVTGAAQPKITQGNLNRIPIRVPAREVLNEFDRTIGPMFDALGSARGHNRALTATRDLLLPRLVSGRLDIDDIDLGALLSTPAAAA